MTHTYAITGMTCGSCQAKVQTQLSMLQSVQNVRVDLAKSEATIEMDRPVSLEALRNALRDYPRYQLSERPELPKPSPPMTEPPVGEKQSWLQTYKPVLMIFAFITGVSLLVEWKEGQFVWMRWMNHFMAGFFLLFSFFKLLNLRGFADSYRMYDVLAKIWKDWPFLYVFFELALGIAFLTGFNPLLTNLTTMLLMTVSLVGVMQTVLNNQRIRCACLGDVFNLPMSTVTIIEDGLMILMSALMLISQL